MHQPILRRTPPSILGGCLLLSAACGDDAQAEAESATSAGSSSAGSSSADSSSAGSSSAESGGTSPGGQTADVLCGLELSVFNADESVNAQSDASWTCEGTTRTLVANGIPDHEVGTFPNPANPNTITEQTVEVTFPLSPEIANEAGTFAMVVAYCLNGVKFEVGTAGTCNDAGECDAIGNGGEWRMEAIGENSFDFGNDESHGHVQPTGQYHYHGIPEGYLAAQGNGEQMTQVGWAVDGFPMYARYGYVDPQDETSGITEVLGSYVLIDAVDPNRPSVDVYPLGAFTQDWEYTEGSGDLDECNGRFGVTPEFPDGIYHYYLTDTFPYGQRCVKGTANDDDDDDGGGGPPPMDGGGPPPGG